MMFLINCCILYIQSRLFVFTLVHVCFLVMVEMTHDTIVNPASHSLKINILLFTYSLITLTSEHSTHRHFG